MVGQGALRECLLDPTVDVVLSVSRSPLPQNHPKLQQLIAPDVANLSASASQLTGFDACLFCLGISSAGMSEADYRRITYDLTLSVAKLLAEHNPQMTFLYISGRGSNSTSRSMWARVKGKTENALLRLPFRDAIMFRPGFIQPRKGIRSKTGWYNAIYIIFFPLYLLLYPFKGIVTDTSRLGKALVRAAINGSEKKILQQRDINRLAEQ